MSATATTLADENGQELAALCRMLARAHGFRLGFAVANHPSLRSRIVLGCARICGLRPREVTLDVHAPEGIVAQLERAIGDDQPAAPNSKPAGLLTDRRDTARTQKNPIWSGSMRYGIAWYAHHGRQRQRC
jgi:hypothetical protein